MTPQTPKSPQRDEGRPAAPDSMTAQLRNRVEELEHRCAEQQQTEAALRAGEERLRLALEATNDGIWDWNVQSGEAYFSPSYYTMLGYAPGEFPASYRSWQRLIHPDDLPAAEQVVRDHVAHRAGAFAVEFRMRTKAGKWRWILGRGTVVERDAEGRAARMAGSHTDITERKWAEDALRRSEEKFSKAFHTSPDAININRLADGVYLEVNRGFSSMTGYDAAEVFGKSSAEINIWCNPEDRAHLVRGLQETGEVTNLEAAFRMKDGRVRIGLMSSTLIEVHGEPCILSITRDITERKRAEEALRAKTEELDRYFTHALDLLCIADTDGYFRRLNREWETVLGYSISELEGTRFLAYVHPEDMEETTRAVARLGAQQEVLNFVNRYRAKDGSYRWIEWRSIPAGDFIYAAARDITERKRAEEALRAAEEKYRGIFENAMEAITQTTPEGRYITANPAAARMLGYESPEALIADISDIARQFYVQSGRRETFKTLMEASGTVDGFESEVYRKDGSTIWVLENSRAIRDAQGTVRCYETISQEVTERKRIEDALRVRTQQLEAVRSATEELTRELELSTLLRLFHSRAMELVGGDSGGVYLWDEAAQLLVAKYWQGMGPWMADVRIPPGEGVAGSVAAGRQGLMINDYPTSPYAQPFWLARSSHVAVLAEPLCYRERFIGVITINRDDPARPFQADDQRLLRLFAAPAAIAVVNAQVHEGAQRELAERAEAEQSLRAYQERLGALLRSSLALARVQSLEHLVGGLGEACSRLLNADGGDVRVLDEQDLVKFVGWGDHESVASPTRLAMGQGLSGAMAVRRTPVVVDNLSEDERLSPQSRDLFRRLGHRTWFGVPIVIGDRLLGTLNMWSRERFSPEDFAIATAFAAQAAVALENARLYAEVRRELGERRRAEERLQEAVREKDVLLRELHHRVKNNMQIISSLLRLQSRQGQTPEVREVFRESQSRVRSMALVHELLYQSEDLARIRLSVYFKKLAQGLYRAYGADPGRIRLHLEVAEIDVGVDVAIPCGLVVGELLSNALKHAFPAGQPGTIWIRAARDEGNGLRVAVKDDGVGMPPGADRGIDDSLGLRLVRMLTEEQLRGEVYFLGGTGTECRLRIPMETR